MLKLFAALSWTSKRSTELFW